MTTTDTDRFFGMMKLITGMHIDWTKVEMPTPGSNPNTRPAPTEITLEQMQLVEHLHRTARLLVDTLGDPRSDEGWSPEMFDVSIGGQMMMALVSDLRMAILTAGGADWANWSPTRRTRYRTMSTPRAPRRRVATSTRSSTRSKPSTPAPCSRRWSRPLSPTWPRSAWRSWRPRSRNSSSWPRPGRRS